MDRWRLAIEAGGTKILIALYDRTETPVHLHRIPSDSRAAAVAEIQRFVQAHLGSPSDLEAVGVASFGPLNRGVIQSTPKLGWTGFDWFDLVAEWGPIPCRVDTDVNAAALAEYHARRGKVRSLAYLTVGTGIGAGFVLEGTILEGMMHPEAGHQLLGRESDDAFPGVCPFHGSCWEGLASGPALRARWGQVGEDLPPDHPAWDLEARYLARGCLNLFYTVQPEVLVLGGGVGSAGELRSRVTRYLRDFSAGYLGKGSPLEEWDLRLQSPLLPHPGLAGAALLARQAARDS